MLFFFFKQKTAYEMRISDWRSDVCSSDLRLDQGSGESQPLPAGVDGALGEQIPVDGKPAQIDRRAEPAARDADGPGRDAQGSESGDAGRWSAGFVGVSVRK